MEWSSWPGFPLESIYRESPLNIHRPSKHLSFIVWELCITTLTASVTVISTKGQKQNWAQMHELVRTSTCAQACALAPEHKLVRTSLGTQARARARASCTSSGIQSLILCMSLCAQACTYEHVRTSSCTNARACAHKPVHLCPILLLPLCT